MNNMDTSSQGVIGVISHLSQPRHFTNDEALELISLLVVISERAKKEINNYNAQLAYFKNNADKTTMLQEKINQTLQTWSDKMRRLGAMPMAFLKVKIPSEQGFYYWEYPSTSFYLQ